MISAREAVGSRDDIWTSAEKGYDMKNDMLWSVYHILQHSFPESIPVFSEYRVTGSLVICVVLCRLLFIFFVHCIVCPSTIYSFWPPLCSSFCPLYCLSFYNLQFLTTSLFIFFVHCIVWPSTIYSFWPPLCSSFCPLYCLSFYNLQFLTTSLFIFLSIVLSVLLQFTVSDHPFGIFKLVFKPSKLLLHIFCYLLSPKIHPKVRK